MHCTVSIKYKIARQWKRVVSEKKNLFQLKLKITILIIIIIIMIIIIIIIIIIITIIIKVISIM